MSKILPLLLMSCVALISGCVTAGPDRVAILEQHIAAAEEKIAGLENTLEENLQTGVVKKQNHEELQSRFAETRVEIDELNAQIQVLSGKIEELNFLLEEKIAYQKSKQEKIEEIIAVNEHRISKLEEYLNFETTGTNKTQGRDTQDQPNASEKDSQEVLYAKAKEAFDQGNLEYARVEFQKVLERYPNSEKADNAQFWIAEIYYREKWYEKAVLEYQKVIENYPEGNKVPAALLKQGFAFVNMDDRANAGIILNELVKKYPESPEADAARAKLEGL